MKTCPHCHIQVGGSAQYCPLCQNPLVGTPEPDHYPKVVPPARQTSLFYRIAAFVLLGAAVICGVVDYIMIEGRHMHWSLLVLIGAGALTGGVFGVRRLIAKGKDAANNRGKSSENSYVGRPTMDLPDLLDEMDRGLEEDR